MSNEGKVRLIYAHLNNELPDVLDVDRAADGCVGICVELAVSRRELQVNAVLQLLYDAAGELRSDGILVDELE